jgi:pimeloyl-ACP methyl ester carboxylesterase
VSRATAGAIHLRPWLQHSTPGHLAADLHTLLERAHVPGPYVLAGHSFGGLYVQSFAAQFPDQVAGMVLLESTASALAKTDRGCLSSAGDARWPLGQLMWTQGVLPRRSKPVRFNQV